MSDDTPNIAVVGGGLAGLAAALRLRERGLEVTVFESAQRLGGKAGAMVGGSDHDDHGFHLFPLWYRNVHQLIDEVGIHDSFKDCRGVVTLDRGEFPEVRSMRNFHSLRWALHNLTNGYLPVSQMFLLMYANLDLMSMSYQYDDVLDQTTTTGFLRSRFYRTDILAHELSDVALKGTSVPSYELSAITFAKMAKHWLSNPEPMFRMPKGSLFETFIEPIRRHLEALGVKVRMGERLVKVNLDGAAVSGLAFRSVADDRVRTTHFDAVILAVPYERLLELLDDELFTAAPTLSNLEYLRGQPMAALNVYCSERLADMPSEHCKLFDSKYSLSFVDVSQTWEGYDNTFLNVVVSDYAPLSRLSPEVATQALLEEIRSFVPALTADRIDRTVLAPHVEERFCLNAVGNWPYRPGARTEIGNLFLAGDYCRSPIDLMCMEGAVTTGLLAAEETRKRVAPTTAPVDVLTPQNLPDVAFVAAKHALLPAAVLAKLATIVLPSQRSRR